MDASPLQPPKPYTPHPETIKHRLLRKGISPTPKIIHTLLKKETQKSLRKSKPLSDKNPQNPPISLSQIQTMEEEAHFQTLTREFKSFMKELKGKPWEGGKSIDLRGTGSGSKEYGGEKLKGEYLEELREMLAERNGEEFRWILEDDLEEGGVKEDLERGKGFDWKREIREEDGIQLLIDRFVYTKLLAVLGKSRRPSEALRIFNMMLDDCHIYPDMPAYRSIAVTLGQAGHVKELFNVIECMRQKPSKRIKNMRKRNWDLCLEPDVVIFNAVLNACVPTQQWKGVSWVLEQMRHSGLKPTGATYGLAMEVMLKSRKYDLVHKYFEKMRRSGLAPKAITYKVLVRAFWEEGKVNDAVEAVRNMEQIGVVGAASVYYELACCLCYFGRWQEAMVEVEKMKKIPLSKPLEVAFTGMIQSCMDGGHVKHCISIFEHMKDYCNPNIGTINAMLKVYGRNDMFAQAKELFEETKKTSSGFETYLGDHTCIIPDAYSYSSMLEASASAHRWEYFEYVYKEMTLCGSRLDQNKHACVLVEASRAGKWHLLEHAFDTILEAGEIPRLSLFTEMLCQNIARRNYERAAPLVNSMAHASLQVSEKQWTGLFSRNQDRISIDELQNLLDSLQNSDIMTEEPTVSNLLKSLQYLSGSSSFNNSFRVLALGENGDTGSDTSTVYQTDGSDDDDDDDDNIDSESDSFVGFGNKEQSITIHGNLKNSGDDQSVTEMTLDLLTRREEDSRGSELPSASEILEKWRENRNKDGIFLL
ncbi:tetratricopeptide repeat (TPR)-like superfamily protein isoform X2 [Tasmannia lanceolata]|uniref:tetratricopeptide repeat (TPR)-like superfamily protein isoform X2 n=1 Tax=Tasmannia lanceolata TaxID=3420 RepID=UPI0040649818